MDFPPVTHLNQAKFNPLAPKSGGQAQNEPSEVKPVEKSEKTGDPMAEPKAKPSNGAVGARLNAVA